MKGIYKSIDFYRKFKLSNGKEIKIKRLKLGEYIAFIVNLRAWKLKQDMEAVKEVFTACLVDRPGKIPGVDVDKIMEAIKEFNTSERDQDQDGKIASENWLTDIISFFAVHCKYTKAETLDLYADEIPDLMAKIVELQQQAIKAQADLFFYSCAYGFNDPGKYPQYVKERDKAQVKNSADTQELQKLQEMEKSWLSKYYGDKDVH